MAFYAGFDILQYPNMAMMNWLNQNTNLVWCGYYLAPAPKSDEFGIITRHDVSVFAEPPNVAHQMLWNAMSATPATADIHSAGR